MIKVVLFDLDDTLYAEIQFVSSGFRAVSNTFGTAQFPPEVVEGLLWQFYRDDRRAVLDRLAATIWEAGEAHWVALGFGTVSDLSQAMIQCYREHVPGIHLFPDAERVLFRLGKRGIRLGLVTDGIAAVQRRKVEALGLSKLEFVMYTDELAPNRAAWKPSPQPFLAALEYFAVLPQMACYVGDNPEKDFTGPKSLGMKTVWIRREGGVYAAKYMDSADQDKVESDCVITNLDELLWCLELDKE